MPPKKEQKSKAQKALAAASSSRSKQKKKKWSKGKVKDKKNNACVFDQATFDRILKDIPKVITIATLSEKFKINGSLARHTILELERKGLIKRVAKSASMMIYTRLFDTVEEPIVKSEKDKKKEKGKKGKKEEEEEED